MNFRILKKDFRRKKSVNVILLVFIVLATTFIAGGVKNFVTIMGATEKFVEESGVSDYTIMTLGSKDGTASENDEKIQAFLEKQKNVKSFHYDELVWLTQTCFKKQDGKKIKLDGMVGVASYKIKQQKFFDKDNNEIKQLKNGYIYFSKKGMDKNNLKEGDKLVLSSNNGYKKEFILKGYVKDVTCGSELIGMNRLVINEEDYVDIAQKGDFSRGNFISVQLDDWKNVDKFVSDYNKEGFSVAFNADKKLLSTSYMMDMMFAAMLVMVSMCLIIISAIMLRFTIVFTVSEDYKEIGIMKAIGIKNGAIRKLYLTKYFVIACIGSIIGFGISIPFEKTMIKPVSDLIVIRQEDGSMVLQAVLSACVVAVVMMFAYFSTKRIKKLSPMDAIRNGNNGERFKKKGKIRLSKSNSRVTSFLAVNDVLCELKRYLVLLLAGMAGVWLVVMPANTINTLTSDSIVGVFSMTKSDLVVDDAYEVTLKKEKQAYYDHMNESKEKLRAAGVPVKQITMELFYNLRIQKGDHIFKSLSMQGLNTKMKEYDFIEGTAPKHENEVAITEVVADHIDAKIGDKVLITTKADEEKQYLVTAIFQSMTNMGQGIRFVENAEIDCDYIAGTPGMQLRLDKGNGEDFYENLKEYVKKTEEVMDGAQVKTMKKYVGDMIGSISDKITEFKSLVLIVVIAISILIVVLMQKMFMVREEGKIAMFKALGFSNGKIIQWQLKRISMVLIIGIILGVVTATPFSQITSGQIFKMMGTAHIEFVVRPLEVYVLYPALIFAAAIAGCAITMRKVKKIKTSEVNSME